MADDAWLAVLEHAQTMHEGEHISARSGNATLYLERRADVLIAMREIASSVDDVTPFEMQTRLTTHLSHCQVLSFGETRYLCAWRRRPTDTHWLEALAAIEI
ncbi:hypothetical protein [Ralstonia mojiangensis]|uniref:hypothetical protein n=1 Tax=Ralstonia mojiangensis TaxID=2953895 RepID=UPI0021B32F3B|nr:hypothetical protein [Ralstonia mojiangensis]MCT7328833.1 hypothetical protein [Ralstonia mojiangensis]